MISSSARQYFYQEVQQPDEYINLARAALYIAQEEYPNINPEEYINALDSMASELLERLPSNRYPLRIIQSINDYLYEDLGFSGNASDYYDPRNSFLNEVIDRRLGIPITLSLVYLEVTSRINFPMLGVGMPGHFLIRPDFPDMEIFVDAFNNGEVMFLEDCEERLSQIYQQKMSLQSDFLAPVSKKQFLARMLTNLKVIYVKKQELEKALAAVERILILFPEIPLELRDRGLLYFQLGYVNRAILDFEKYLTKEPLAQDAETIRTLLAQLRKNMDN
ncbi:MAG: SirB1 family protein [Cyanobacteria bacterium P01_A01_bin.68]